MTRDEYVEAIMERFYQTITPSPSLQLEVRGIVEATVDVMLELQEDKPPTYYLYLTDGRFLTVASWEGYYGALDKAGVEEEQVHLWDTEPVPDAMYNESKRDWEYNT